MATVIRFARHGTKKKPYFRIVVQDKRSPRDGRFIEHIGAFDPIKESPVSIERDRLMYWIGAGAQMSESVRNRLMLKMKEWQTAGGTPAPEAKPQDVAPKAAAKKAKPSKEA